MPKHIPQHIKPSLRRFIDQIQVKAAHAIRYPPRSREELINDRELRFFGLPRSGNHAIINWIFVNLTGTTCFLNNIRPRRHHNPYLSFGQALLKNGEEIINYPPDLPDKHRLVRNWHLQHPHKNTLMYSYENRRLDTVPADALSREHDRCVGRSSRSANVLILRDPFNCFASLFKRRTELNREPVPATFVEKWKSYAREFVGDTHYLEPVRITISYNRWCVNDQYRQSLAERLGLVGAESGVKDVPNIGGGSSFDGLAFTGDAVAMRTGERWREFEDREDYRRVFADREIVELSQRIFGEIPGTTSLSKGRPRA